jgi:hypothetical protein
MSGTATADEINRGLRAGKQRIIGRLIILEHLMTLGLLVGLAPLPARADEDKDIGHGHEDNDKGIRAEITALKAQVAALQDQVNTLQGQLAAIRSNHALLLGPFVNVDPNPEIGVIGPNIIFSGANIHIVSGSGSTDDNGNPTGLGNLIIGYDEDPKNYFDRSPVADLGGLPLSPLNPGDRGGSHNLVVGAANRFTRDALGGLIVGTANTIQGYGVSVSGGGNTASGYGASVSGGFSNSASGPFASVSAGRFNSAAQFFTSVSGGENNTAAGEGGGRFNGLGASVSGGASNTASGNLASVSGGVNNTAFDYFTSVTGGIGNTAGNRTTFQGGFAASVVGGFGNTAGGRNTVVIGGQDVTDNTDNSIAPQPPFP